MRTWRWVSVLAVLVLVLAACGQQAGPSGSGTESEAPASEPPTSEGPFTATAYPEAPAECGAAADDTHDAYTGNIEQIRADDATTVVFDLCNPDVAFLSKVAFTSFAINDSAYLEEHAPGGSIVAVPNGTGPYKLDSWSRGSEIVLSANPDYWGEAPLSPTVIFRWSAEAAQRLVELQAGHGRRHRQPGSRRLRDDRERPEPAAVRPRKASTPSTSGSTMRSQPWDNEEVRQAIAMGLDRQASSTRIYPPGSEVASHFTPCAIPFGCTGDEWYEYDPDAAQEILEPLEHRDHHPVP